MDGNVQMNFDPMTGEPLKPAAEPVAAEPVAAEPTAAEPAAAEPVATEPVATEPVTAAEPVAAEPVTQPVTQPAPQPVYTEPAPQPVYAQPVYTQPAAQPVYVQPVYVQQPAPQPAATNEVVYPGKEIVGLVFGIFSLINGICGLAIVIPIYGWIFGGICAVSGIIYAIVAKSQWGTIKKNATSYSSKIKTGNGLATAGLIISILAIVIGIIVLILFILVAALGVGGSILDSLGYSF